MRILRNDSTLNNLILTNSEATPDHSVASGYDYRYPVDGPEPSPGLIEDDAFVLSNFLSFSSCITSLVLTHNNLGSGTVELMRNLTHLTKLSHLRIDDQSMTADIAADILNTAVFFGMTHLRTLELDCHQVISSQQTEEVRSEHNIDIIAMNATYTLHQLSNHSKFSASDVVSSNTWNQLSLSRPPDEITRAGYGAILQYLMSVDKVSSNELRIFVVGESTVCLFAFLHR
jgi:hypothetical protein